MLKPLTLMARVLAIFSITIVQAQSTNNSSMLCYISADNTTHLVDSKLIPAQPYTITCTYNEKDASIPKFIQFSCSGASVITVDVHVTNGTTTQKISKDIRIQANRAVYEVPVLAYVNDNIMQSGNARINAIEFSNTLNQEAHLNEVYFTNTSSNYEVKFNQIFTVDLDDTTPLNYFIKSNEYKDVQINVYKSKGEYSTKLNKNLNIGDNFIMFDELSANYHGKYIVVITENKPNNKTKKSSNSNITVMND